MNEPIAIQSLTVWEPEGNALYTLEHVAQFAGLPRRHIVLYARHGFVAPAIEPGEGWYFSAEAIRTLRRIARLRSSHGLELSGVRLVLDLMNEIDRLRVELRSA